MSLRDTQCLAHLREVAYQDAFSEIDDFYRRNVFLIRCRFGEWYKEKFFTLEATYSIISETHVAVWKSLRRKQLYQLSQRNAVMGTVSWSPFICEVRNAVTLEEKADHSQGELFQLIKIRGPFACVIYQCWEKDLLVFSYPSL